MTKSSYNTKQRNLIVNLMCKNKDKHFTAEMLVSEFKGRVGQTTIYRNLNKLLAEGIIIKYDLPGGLGSCYQYLEEDNSDSHAHMICDECGRIIHLDCNQLSAFQSHILDEHNFKIKQAKTVLYGLCDNCI